MRKPAFRAHSFMEGLAIVKEQVVKVAEEN